MMNIRLTPFIAVLITAITLFSVAAPASAATAPGTAKRKRAEAKEAFKLEISKVYLEETDGNFKDVLMEAKVTEVLRTACGVKAGETIMIKSRRRFMTDEEVRGSIESFNEPPLVLRKGWTGNAYLRVKDAESSLKTFGVVLEGFSFLAEASQTSKNVKPKAKQDSADEQADATLKSILKELEALNESRPLDRSSKGKGEDLQNGKNVKPKAKQDSGDEQADATLKSILKELEALNESRPLDRSSKEKGEGGSVPVPPAK